MRFRVLGPICVLRDGALVGVTGGMQRRLLAVLAAHAGTTVSTDTLAETLWPGDTSADVHHRLQLHVHRMRRLLGGRDRIGYEQDGYRFRVEPDELDASRFERLVTAAVRGNGTDPAAAAERAGQALALWRGAPFGGLDVPVLLDHVRRLDELRLTATELWHEGEIRSGRHGAVVAGLTELAQAHPLRERLCGLLMTALSADGRQAEALAAYRTTRRLLVDELGIEPGPELQAVHRQVLAGELPDPASVAAVPTATEPARLPVEQAVDDQDGPSGQPATDGQPGADDGPFWGQCQLPGDIIDFTGRGEELRTLHDLLERPADRSPTICVLHGMGGVGKTRLAVHLAHYQVQAGRCPDGQLYADLRGVAATQPPARPTDIIESFLRQLGVPGAQIPAELTARAALFRSRLADRRVLILLDNAGTETQLLPLLPSGRHCTVLITSRRNLALEGAVSLHVDVFPEADARQFLAINAGTERVDAEPAAAAEIVRLCGHLPIAIALAAHRLRARPAWRLTDLLARMRNPHRILTELVAGSRAVQDVIDLSYRALSPLQQRIFRLVGTHPGADVTAHSIAAMAELDPRTAERQLEALLDEHLLIQTMPDRYRMHDLLRAYAHHLTGSAERDPDGLHRLLLYYRQTSTRARQALGRHPVFDEPRDEPDLSLTIRDRDDALCWFYTERAAMVAAIHAGAEARDDRLTWQLAAMLLSFCYLSKHWDDWIDTHRVGLVAAQRVGDTAGAARLHMGLGVAYDDLGRYDEAIAEHEAAAALFTGTGDRRGEAWNLNNLGVVYDNQRRYDLAADRYRAALTLFGQLDDPKGQGLCLNNLGDVHRAEGRYADAEDCLRQALHVQQNRVDREAQRIIWGTFGDLYRDTGDIDRAAHAYRQAIDLCVEFDDRWRADQLRRHLAELPGAVARPAADVSSAP